VPQFSPSDVTYKDEVGYGYWDDSHHRQHQQYVETLATLTPSILIPNYDFLQMLTAANARGSIVETHMQAHAVLRQILNVQGVDLTQFNLDSEDDFNNFLSYHDADHQGFNLALGIV
jgi:hypothetical protein